MLALPGHAEVRKVLDRLLPRIDEAKKSHAMGGEDKDAEGTTIIDRASSSQELMKQLSALPRGGQERVARSRSG